MSVTVTVGGGAPLVTAAAVAVDAAAMAAVFGSMLRAVNVFTASGRLAMSTDKPYYVSGELVTGHIQAQISGPISASAIVLQVVGYEKTEWNVRMDQQEMIPGTQPPEYRTIIHVHRHRGKKTFFNVVIPIYNLQNGTLMPGTYDWPFSYQLPDGLPGSFFERREMNELPPGVVFHDDQGYGDDFYDSDDEYMRGDFKDNHIFHERSYHRPEMVAIVQYKLKASLDVNGVFSRDLHAKQPIVVYPRLGADLKPAFAERSADVMVCCCINKGRAAIKCSFDKNAYSNGEVAQINADVDNQSEKELVMHVKLYRTLTLRSMNGQTKAERTVVAEQKYDAVAPKTQKQQQMPLPLVGAHIKPATNGQFVVCTYEYGVNAAVSWGSDININLPVNIYAPQPPKEYYQHTI